MPVPETTWAPGARIPRRLSEHFRMAAAANGRTVSDALREAMGAYVRATVTTPQSDGAAPAGGPSRPREVGAERVQA
jgi:hypothetical protein